MRHHNLNRDAGFTLIEVIMSLVIFGIVASLGVSMMGNSIRSYVEGREVMDADGRARTAIERITRELRTLRSNTATDLNIGSPVEMRFINQTGNGVCFYLTGNTLMRSDDFAAACGSNNPQALADRVSLLNFTYLQVDGTTAAGASNQTRFITVRVDVMHGINPITTTAYRTSVTVRAEP